MKKYTLNETIATGKFKQVLAENYTKNFELLCNSIKLNKVQQKILDSFINHGTIKNQYVGRVAGVKKEKKFFAAKKSYKGSIDNRTEALMKALKVNTHQQKILDSYLKTGKVIGKYAGSIAGSTKVTKDYSAFRGFKEHVELESLTEAKSLNQIFSIFKRDVKAYNSGKELSQDATMAFMYYAMKNGEIKTDDADEFDQWLDNNIPESVQREGTWKKPESSNNKRRLKDLLAKPIPLGKDGDYATDQIDSLIGDDDLFDDLYSAGKKNMNADARPIIKKAMKRLGIKI